MGQQPQAATCPVAALCAVGYRNTNAGATLAINPEAVQYVICTAAVASDEFDIGPLKYEMHSCSSVVAFGII